MTLLTWYTIQCKIYCTKITKLFFLLKPPKFLSILKRKLLCNDSLYRQFFFSLWPFKTSHLRSVCLFPFFSTSFVFCLCLFGGGGGVGSCQLIWDTKGGHPSKFLTKRRGGHQIIQKLPVKSHQPPPRLPHKKRNGS